MATAAAAAVVKQKCEFWDKCYRKNKQHREQFLHPGDEEKPSQKPRLTHDISQNDDDPTPAKRKGTKRKSTDEEEATTSVGPSTSTDGVKASPTKIAKYDDKDEEKIAPDYSKGKKKAEAKNGDDAKTAALISNKTGDASKEKKSDVETIKYKAKKEKCKYWDKCYQTSQAHKKEFYHPGDDVPKEDSEKKKTRGQTGTPQNPLEDGGTVEFDSGYKLERDGENYTCTCKGFVSQRAPINERTCKHLKEYNGEEFERARIEKNAKPKKVSISSHINVSLLLAHKYDEKTNDPVGWWISEKLDGVRAFWNGRCFYSRLGNAFYAPEWFTKDLPKDMTLDGELFGGRGQFQSTVSIVKTAESPKWKDIKYYVFDSPNMGKEVFEKRMETIKQYFENTQPEYAVFVEQVKCTSKAQLDKKLNYILNIGGEGLMIRQPKSVYEKTRSKTLLKIKKFYDAEAVVIGHEKGKGVNQNRCGALRCRMACGKEFSVGSGLTDKDRNRPPKIGSIITYKFQELSKSGSPRFPTYVGIRIDMTEPKDAEIRPVLEEEDA